MRPEPRIVQRRQLGQPRRHQIGPRAAYFASRPATANLFHGHTARQSSQP